MSSILSYLISPFNQYIVPAFKALTATPVDYEAQYQEVMRRLPPAERQPIEEKVGQVTDGQINDLVTALNQQQWHATLFGHDGAYTHQALAALRQGKITQHQFATIMFFWVNHTQQGIRTGTVIFLFNSDGSINPKARQLLGATLKGRLEKFSASEMDQFFEKMRKLPASEQCFFVRKMEKSYGFDIIASIQGSRIDLFYDTQDGKMMIPSAGMMQSFLDVRFKDQAVKINPVLGLSTEEDIRNNGLTGTRDMGLHFPGTTLPEQADDLEAIGYKFTYHDFYHALVASNAPPEHRKLFIKLADSIKSSPLPYAQNLAKLMVDMEANAYTVIQEGYTPLAIAKDQSDESFWMACFGYHLLLTNPDESRIERFKDIIDPITSQLARQLLSEEEKQLVHSLTAIVPLPEETRQLFISMNAPTAEKFGADIKELDIELESSTLSDKTRLQYTKEKNFFQSIVNNNFLTAVAGT
jgi:hypothetical protein